MTAREPDPIAATRCPQCLSTEVTEADDYELDITGLQWYCPAVGCDLFFAGTASEAARYAARRIADDAARGGAR